jgi:hypothetical protein
MLRFLPDQLAVRRQELQVEDGSGDLFRPSPGVIVASAA